MGLLTIDGYIHRIVDDRINKYLQVFGAVVIEGPKWCGKTTTAKNHAASETSMTNPAGDFQERTIARLEPALAIKGDRPRLIDEWQDVPKLWDAVRYECDQSKEKGLYILTGSTVPKTKKGKDDVDSDSKPRHSGAGRMKRMRMNTMSLLELGLSSGEISLSGVFEGRQYAALSKLDLAGVADLVVRGGWPDAIGLSTEAAILISRGYLDAVINEDIHEIDGTRRDVDKVRKMIASLARNEATLATTKTIINDISDVGGDTITYPTFNEYIDALRRMFFVDDIPAWNPALRSPVRIRASVKHHLADPSLASAALGASQERLIAEPKTLGFLFESLVTHDLIVYAEAMDACIRHYHDDVGLEVDLIVEKSDGDWAAFEIKLGFDQVEEAVSSLISLRDKMVDHGQKPPNAMGVIIGTGGVGHMREDGVQIIPIDTLGV